MKKVMLMLGMALALSVSANDVFVELNKGAVYMPQRVAFWKNLVLTNGLNRYHMTFQLMKPYRNKGVETLLSGLHTPQGFCAMVKSLDLKVNGIALTKIHLGPECLIPFEKDGKKGVVWKMNFDGARLGLAFYMRPDSGVLWCELVPDRKNSLEAIRSAQLTFTCVPSRLRRSDKGHSMFNEGYDREVKTPVRTYRPQARAQELTPEDTCMIFYDKFLDGTTEAKGFGPCMLMLDTEVMAKGFLHLRNSWTNTVTVDLKPDFKHFRFGIWNSEARISNADFMKMVESKKKAFELR